MKYIATTELKKDKTNYNINKFYKTEFERIRKLEKWDYEKILSVKNYKSQAPLIINETIVAEIQEILNNLNGDNYQETIKKLCKKYGINFSTASTFLAIENKRKFAILDSRIVKFMKCKKFSDYLCEEFENYEVRKYKNWKNIQSIILKGNFNPKNYSVKQLERWISVYELYLGLLNDIKRKSNKKKYTNLREIEYKIFENADLKKSNYSTSRSIKNRIESK